MHLQTNENFKITMILSLGQFSAWILLSLFGLFAGVAHAASYVLPGSFGSGPFAGCVLGVDVTYNCPASISLGNGDVVTGASTYKINVSGNFTTGTSVVMGSAVNKLNLFVSGNVTLGAGSTLNGSVMTVAGSTTLGNGAKITDNLQATSSVFGSTSLVEGIVCTGTCNTSLISRINASGIARTSNGSTVAPGFYTINPTIGNVIVVVAWASNVTSVPTLSAADNYGNTYTSIAQANIFQDAAGYQSAAILVAPVKATGPGLVVTVNALKSKSKIVAEAIEYSGIAEIDQKNARIGSQYPPNISTAGPTAYKNELVVSVLGVLSPNKTFKSILTSFDYVSEAVEINNNGKTAGESSTKIAINSGVQSNEWAITPSTGPWDYASAIVTFRPGAAIYAPSVTTGSGVTAKLSAILNAIVSSNGAPTTVSFDYGFDINYGLSVSAKPDTLSEVATSVGVRGYLDELLCGRTYHFRAVARNIVGITYGADQTFTTKSCANDFDAYETNLSAPAVSSARILTRVSSRTGLCIQGGSCALKIGSFLTGTRKLNTSFSGPVKLEIVDASVGTCATYANISNWQSSQILGDTGETIVNLPALTTAWANARIRISYPSSGTPTVQSCSSDNFAIRPDRFALAAKDANETTSGMTRNLSISDVNGAPYHRAGRPFTLIASALTAQGEVISNYEGKPVASLSACAGTACLGALGTLSSPVDTFSSGVLALHSVTYSEAGAFNLTYTDDSFAAVDASDTNSTKVKYIFGSTKVGRFTPDHFDILMMPGCSEGANSFTYSGQPFGLILTARNAQGATTVNYANAAFAKNTTLTPQGALTGTLSLASIAPSSFVSGAATLTALSGPSYRYASKYSAPSHLSILATDEDAVSSSIADGGAPGSLLLRSGQLKVYSASGSDRGVLKVPLALQFWSGASWVANGDDVCTSFPAAAFAITSASNTSATYTPGSAVLSGGSGYVPVTPSTSSTTAAGSVNLAVNLGSSGVDQSCFTHHAGAASSRPWLRSFNGSCSMLANRDPGARLRFGIYTNETRRQIYLREIR